MVAPTHHRTYPFAFDPHYTVAGRLFGIEPRSAYVAVADGRLMARFGPWLIDTPVHNVGRMALTGPFSTLRTIGPARLSGRDHGLTFATNADSGLCLSFGEPIRGIDPFGLVRHPGLTVTVAEPEAVAEAVVRAQAAVVGHGSTGAVDVDLRTTRV